MDTEKRIESLEKKVDLLIKAQQKFFPKFDELLKNQKELIKAFNKLNESANTMGSMANMIPMLMETPQFANIIQNLSDMTDKSKEQTPNVPV